MKTRIKIGIIVGLAVILLATIGVSLGVYLHQLYPIACSPQSGTVVEKAVPRAVPAEMSDEDRQFLRQLDQEIALAKEQEAMSTAQPVAEPIQPSQTVADAPSTTTPDQFQNQSTQDMPQWDNMWSDLKLTSEEQARLSWGFAAIVKRIQSMTPEQQQAEMEKFQEGMLRLQMMSEEERKIAGQRMQERFQESREDGEELTDFPFD